MKQKTMEVSKKNRFANHETKLDDGEDSTAPGDHRIEQYGTSSSAETALIAVDRFPSPKERNKTITRVTTRLLMLLLDQKWPAFGHYTRFLARKCPRDSDVSMLCDIYRVDHLRNIRESSKAVAMFSDMDRRLSETNCPSLSVRYLTSKAITLYFHGEQEKALSLQQQALQMSENQAPSNSTAFNLTVYALHGCLHCVDDHGNNVIPREHNWQRAEAYYRRACEHHVVWTKDLEDATKIPEKVCASFFLYSFVRYIFALVRSCVAGGFIYFERHQCPPCNIEKASTCIERVKKECDVLSIRIKFEFALVQCDYFLRKAQSSVENNDRRNMYHKSQHSALEAFKLATKIPDANHALSCGSYASIRLHYIQTKLGSLDLGELHGHQSGPNMDISMFSFISHISPFVGLTHRPSKANIDRDLAMYPAENLTAAHQAGCPECALEQTLPKEFTALNLNLSEHGLQEHGNSYRTHGYLGSTSSVCRRQCPPTELSPGMNRLCKVCPRASDVTQCPVQPSAGADVWLGKHDNVRERLFNDNRNFVDITKPKVINASGEDTAINLISTSPSDEEIWILKRE